MNAPRKPYSTWPDVMARRLRRDIAAVLEEAEYIAALCYYEDNKYPPDGGLDTADGFDSLMLWFHATFAFVQSLPPDAEDMPPTDPGWRAQHAQALAYWRREFRLLVPKPEAFDLLAVVCRDHAGRLTLLDFTSAAGHEDAPLATEYPDPDDLRAAFSACFPEAPPGPQCPPSVADRILSRLGAFADALEREQALSAAVEWVGPSSEQLAEVAARGTKDWLADYLSDAQDADFAALIGDTPRP